MPTGESTQIDVLANDGPPGDPLYYDDADNQLYIDDVTAPDNGVAQILQHQKLITDDSNGPAVDVISYTPNGAGTTSFTYDVRAGRADAPTETATVYVDAREEGCGNLTVRIEDQAHNLVEDAIFSPVYDADGNLNEDPDNWNISADNLPVESGQATYNLPLFQTARLASLYTPNASYSDAGENTSFRILGGAGYAPVTLGGGQIGKDTELISEYGSAPVADGGGDITGTDYSAYLGRDTAKEADACAIASASAEIVSIRYSYTSDNFSNEDETGFLDLDSDSLDGDQYIGNEYAVSVTDAENPDGSGDTAAISGAGWDGIPTETETITEIKVGYRIDLDLAPNDQGPNARAHGSVEIKLLDESRTNNIDEINAEETIDAASSTDSTATRYYTYSGSEVADVAKVEATVRAEATADCN